MRTQHARRYRRKIERRNAVIAGLAVASITGTVLPAWAARTPPADLAHCTTRVVKPGDTVWRLFDGDMARATELNSRHVQDLNRIYAGDQLVTACPDGPAPVDWQPMTTDLGLIDVTPWLDEREPDGRITWRALAAHLYRQGFRGNDLVIMGGIVHGESLLNPNAVGDENIANDKWGPSVGLYQIRTLNAQKGTGSFRDIDHVTTVEGNVAAAFELVRSRRARGQDPFIDWTVYLKRDSVFAGSMRVGGEAITAAAQEIGVL